MRKVIHYCWFGGNPLPESAIKCIESWKKYCPDYEIKQWDETNFDINCCSYVKEAYAAKKWAFVSDYCRFWILYQFGGVYLDTDVELLQSIDDLPDTFVGFETPSAVASGLIRAAHAGDEICRLMLESYEKDHFIQSGQLNLTTVCIRETNLLYQFGLKKDGTKQLVRGTTVYPVEYFNPKDAYTGAVNITAHTYSIHHYDCSWYSEQEIYATKLKKKLANYIPRRAAGHLAYFIAQCKYDGLTKAMRRTVSKIKRNG